MFLLSLLVDSLFPVRCLKCGEYDHWLCDECRNILPKLSAPTVQFKDPYLDEVVSCFDYGNPVVRALIHTLKYHGVHDVASVCAEEMSGLVSMLLPSIDYIIPVPLAPLRYRWRGFNQSALIGRRLAECLEVQYKDALLKRIRETAPQVRLDIEKRQKNMADAFRAVDKRLLEGKTCLLVDDVFTTGATMRECAKALKIAGAQVVFGVTIAHGEA